MSHQICQISSLLLILMHYTSKSGSFATLTNYFNCALFKMVAMETLIMYLDSIFHYFDELQSIISNISRNILNIIIIYLNKSSEVT